MFRLPRPWIKGVCSFLVASILLVSTAFATPNISTASKNAALNAVTALINTGGAGTLVFYTGTQPAGPDTALSGNTVLVTLTFSATSFASASSGTATANAITSGTAVATGTATFARAYAGNGSTAVIDFSVGTSGSDINLGSTAISSGVVVSISSLTMTHP